MAENLSIQRQLNPLNSRDQYLDITIDSTSSTPRFLDHTMDNDLDDNLTDGSEELHSNLCKKCELPINEGHAYELGGM